MEWSLRRKTYKHPCPDGSLKIVYRSIDDAFPLALKHVGTRLALDLAKLSEIGGQVGAEYRESIAGLLYSLDDLNQSLMMNFRAVYAAYQSDPCANAEFLARQVGKIVEETQRHTEIQVRISGLIGLAQTDGGKRDEMLALFRELVLEVGGSTVGLAAASEVEQAKEDARRWIGESGAETEEGR
jgi:hypothetical protein